MTSFEDQDDIVFASEFEESYEDQREIRGAILEEPLGKVPRGSLLTVTTDTRISEAIKKMNEHRTGCVLVVREGKLAGIFTERDVLRKVAAVGVDIHQTPVSEVMTPSPDTLPASASIAYALQKMSHEGYRHIPLVDEEERPVGVVAVRDIVNWMVALFPASVLNLPPEPGFPKTREGG